MRTVAARIGPIIMAVAFTAMACGQIAAQDVRTNPFLPNSTEEERRTLADKERMRQAIREMMPEIKTMLMPVFEEQKVALTEQIAATAPSAASTASAVDPVTGMPVPVDPNASAEVAAATTPAGEPTIPGTSIPATAKFIACFNGKAMYRDATGTKYFDENATAACPS